MEAKKKGKSVPTQIKNQDLVTKRRRQIIDAAVKLFIEKGFHKTTTRQIAAAAGLPIIASPMGGIPEVVQPGLNGMLLDRKDDPEELADKIGALLADESLRHRLGRQGREWVSARFSWGIIAREQEEVYDQVVKGRA